MSESGNEAVRLAEIEARAAWPVALVSMPFMSPTSPSIQLGLLKAIGAAHGFPITTFHLNLDFAAQIGVRPYSLLCQLNAQRLGEWLFARAAFGAEAPDPDDRLLDSM
jgi:hypothetical protein